MGCVREQKERGENEFTRRKQIISHTEEEDEEEEDDMEQQSIVVRTNNVFNFIFLSPVFSRCLIVCSVVFVHGCVLNCISLSFVWCICVCVVAVVQDAARAAGALPAVIQALETHKGNQDVAEQGCYAVGTLVSGNPANQVPRAL